MNRIKQLREEFGFSQNELAEKLGGAPSSIAMYEKGDRKPSLEVLIKLSDIFNCSIDYLLGKSNTKSNMSSFEDIKAYYEKKSGVLLENKYINEFSNLNLSDSEIKSIMEIITSTSKDITENYSSLLNGLFSIMSLNYDKNILDKIKQLILNYNQDRLDILNEEIGIFREKNKKEIEKLEEEHIHELHPFLSGSSSVSLDEKAETLLNYLDANNIDDFSLIPVVGKIAAGQPILAEQYIEGYLPVDPNIYGMKTSDDLFYLKVAGESMNMKIKNGDFALIHKQDYAEDGDIIVAIVNSDDEATLKRYKKLNDQFVLLEPMSTDPTIEPITVDLKNTKFQIIGKAIGQFGKF